MTRITIDAETREKLTAAGESVELVDETGKLIGTFRPALTPPYDPKLIPPISEEELRRREKETPRYTTEEVIRHLASL